MKRDVSQFPSVVDVVVILLVAVVTVYIEVGFFRIDSTALGTMGSHRMVLLGLWALRMGTIIAGLAIVYVFYGVRYGKLPLASVLLSLSVLPLTAFIVFPLVAYIHGRTFERNIALFHPYLQLVPPTYREAQDTSSSQPLKIFCLGGSTTEFPDSKGRQWPAMVQENLRKALPDHDIQVSNLGRRWYTSLHTLINYQTNLRRHKPDVIIVTHAINDLLQNADFSFLSNGPFRDDYGHFLGPLYRYMKLHSIFNMARSTLDLVWYAPDRKVVETHTFPGLATFRHNLLTLVELARADGTQVVLVTQPFLIKKELNNPEKAALTMVNYEAVGPTKRWSFSTAWSGMEQYTSCVRQLAQETGVYLIDLEKVVPKELEYMYDDVHYTDKSYDLISKAVGDNLVELGVLDNKTRVSQNRRPTLRERTDAVSVIAEERGRP